MSLPALRVVVVWFAPILVLSAGWGVGAWMAAGHYRPILDAVNTDLEKARSARDNLETLAEEQGRKLGELVLAGEARERAAVLAQQRAKDDARQDYAAANRLLRELTGGDPADAAASIIDRELGL